MVLLRLHCSTLADLVSLLFYEARCCGPLILKQTQTQTFAFCRLNFQHLVLRPWPRKTTASYYKNSRVIHNRFQFPLGAAQAASRISERRLIDIYFSFLLRKAICLYGIFFCFVLIVKDISAKCQVQQERRGAALIRRSR